MKRMWSAALLPVVVLTMASCRVTQTEEGEAPDVDVDAGKLPEYDVDPAKIEIGRDTKTVVVPDIDIKTPPRRDTTTAR